MKMALAVGVVVALTGVSHAEDAQDTKSRWSGVVIDRNIGGVGSTTSILKKDIGDGWSVGGQLTTKYQDPNIGGSGTPPPQLFGGDQRSNTVIGPYFEKKF